MNLGHRRLLFALLFSFALLFPSLAHAEKPAPKGKFLVYVGTYTEEGYAQNRESKGIYAFRFDAATGEFTPLGLAAESPNPSFLAVDPTRRFLYAVNEVKDYRGPNSGGVRAFAMDRSTGKLTLLNEVPSNGGDPCYLALDKKGKYVFTANYGGGSVAAFPFLPDGRLGESSTFVQFQAKGEKAPHAHAINVSPDNRFVLTADLGLDQMTAFRFDQESGSFAPRNSQTFKVDPGAGPRHFVFHPNGKFAYVLTELQSGIVLFAYDPASGTLRRLQTVSTLPKGYAGTKHGAEVQVHPSGKFLYASNRGHDSIAVFAINKNKGTLTRVEIVPTKGKEPRHFAIDPTGSYLLAANQHSHNMVVFRIDARTGRLTATGQVLEVPTPVYVKFVALD
jgi:6-phosphogluconolactonase